MVDQEILQEAWAKARTLKAVDNLAAVDPHRTLLMDALQTMRAVSPFGPFDAEKHKAHSEIRAFLTGEDHPNAHLGHGRECLQRGFLIDKLTEASVEFAKGSALYPAQEDVVVAMQRRIQHADPQFLQWLGNPVGELPSPKPAFQL